LIVDRCIDVCVRFTNAGHAAGYNASACDHGLRPEREGGASSVSVRSD
jgi:hypothetical protein